MKISEFKSKLSNVSYASGPRASYRNISVCGNVVKFTRVSTNNEEEVSISQLLDLYKNEEVINTVVARRHISGRVYSPSVAILKAVGLINSDGIRLGFVKDESTQNIKHGDHIRHEPAKKRKKIVKEIPQKSNDETIFFNALNIFLGSNHLYSKSIGYPIHSSDIYLSDDYTKYRFKSDKIKDAFQSILSALNGIECFGNKSLSHYIDGLIHDHPVFGTRIVEFDEEQHFTPAREDSLLILSKSIEIPYVDRYIAICNDLNYMNNLVLNKHRIKQKLNTIPDSFFEFTNWLDTANVSDSGYIASKPTFNFKGGRIAQRAYYDCLRDVAHLSEYNKRHKLQPPLRFAKYTFEHKYDKMFATLTKEEIIKGIKEILKEDFDITT